MSDLDHRVGVKEANLVVRNLRLQNVSAENCEPMMGEIDTLFGIDEAVYSKEDGTVYLAYDATHIDLDGIENVIRKYGADIHDDWWTHTKESYYKFVDQNMKDNESHQAWSCHKQPMGNRRKK